MQALGFDIDMLAPRSPKLARALAVFLGSSFARPPPQLCDGSPVCTRAAPHATAQPWGIDHAIELDSILQPTSQTSSNLPTHQISGPPCVLVNQRTSPSSHPPLR